MTEKRLHPFAALRVLRKTLVLYLVPLVNVLFERNWTALRAALRQDAVLFLLACGLSWVILHVSSWSLDDSTLCLHWKLLFRFDRAIRASSLAAVTIERPFYFRLAGASRVTLYPVGEPEQRTLTLCLNKADAQELADRLLPVRDPSLHKPAGGERAALGLLGANSLSTLALLYLAIRQTRQRPDSYALAFAQINFLAGLAARWLPAGAAWLLAFAGFLLGLSLIRSFVQTIHYEVWHTADQIGSRGGWLDRFECRVRTDQISFADVRISPAARLMKRRSLSRRGAVRRNCRYLFTVPATKPCSGSCFRSSGCRRTFWPAPNSEASSSLFRRASRLRSVPCSVSSPATPCPHSRSPCCSRRCFSGSCWRAASWATGARASGCGRAG